MPKPGVRNICSGQMLVCELMELIGIMERAVDESLFVTGCFADGEGPKFNNSDPSGQGICDLF